MKRYAAVLPVLAALSLVSTAGARSSATCTPTGFVRDGINLTAALIDPGNVTGTVDATGCNIGIYYGAGTKGQVQKANVFGANYYGVVNDGGNVNVQQSSVHDIGETPFNGTQHGVAIYWSYDSGATGNIQQNTIWNYQKGGIVVNGGSDSSQIQNNKVTGLGRVDFIAGNGIQLGYGAHGTIANNTVSGNDYTGTNNASSAGILVFGGCGDPQVTGVDIHNNTVSENDMGIYLENDNADCSDPPSAPTRDSIHNNTISNGSVTNISGDGGGVGYQAGIVDIGNGDDIHDNTISGAGYTSPSTASVQIFAIDTTLATGTKLHNNKIH